MSSTQIQNEQINTEEETNEETDEINSFSGKKNDKQQRKYR